mgnify:CR=1 FL=1
MIKNGEPYGSPERRYEMRTLYDVTATEVIKDLADDLARNQGISKALAKKLILNSLLYNVVAETVTEQAMWLLETDEE